VGARIGRGTSSNLRQASVCCVRPLT